jgi:peptide/nickel transport system substrate-binding protein
MSRRRRISRRTFMQLSVASTAAWIAACAQAPEVAAPTQAPAAATEAPAVATQAPAATVAPTQAPAATVAPTQAPAAPASQELGAHLFGKLEGPTIIRDVAQFPKAFAEAPSLAQLVKDGKLPPVADRLPAPEDLMVVKPLHETGKYGGTLRWGFTGPGDGENPNRWVAVDKLLFVSYDAKEIIPSVAKDWKISDDGKVTTLYLRKGMKWSDGQPFSADDIMFWWKDMHMNKELNPIPTLFMTVKGELGDVVKIDDYTVEFRFPHPYPLFLEVLSGNAPVGNGFALGGAAGGGYVPAHYAKLFHKGYVAEADLAAKVKDGGYDSWVAMMSDKLNWRLNPELPVLTPWKCVSPMNTPTFIAERNPYFWAVDNEGNQLPYVDKIQLELAETLEVLNLRAIAGEYDLAHRHLVLTNLPTFIKEQEKGNYTVRLDKGDFGSDVSLYLNQSYEADPEIVKWFHNRDFRRALSLGIDRDQLNEVFWLGMGTPGNATVSEAHPHYPGPGVKQLWATFEPEKANQMLDAIGLDKKDAEGFRLRTDGKGRLRLDIYSFSAFWMDMPAVLEMIVEQWKKSIGIDAEVKPTEANTLTTMTSANEVMIHVRDGVLYDSIFTTPGNILPVEPTNQMGPLIGKWYSTNGADGVKPEWDTELLKAMDLYRSAASVSAAERIEIGKELMRLAADNVWQIGTVGYSPAVLGTRLVKNYLGNVPERLSMIRACRFPGASWTPTYYFKEEPKR